MTIPPVKPNEDFLVQQISYTILYQKVIFNVHYPALLTHEIPAKGLRILAAEQTFSLKPSFMSLSSAVVA